MTVLEVAGYVVLTLGLGLFVFTIVRQLTSESGGVKVGILELKIPATLVVATIGLVMIVLANFGSNIATALGVNKTQITGTVTPEPPLNSTSTSQPSPSAFKFDKPTDGSDVKGTFPVRGTSPDLHGDSLWLFDYSGNANSDKLVYYKTSDLPIPVQNGNWATTDGPLGGPSDIGDVFTIVAVRATPACSDIISHVRANDAGDLIVGPELPPGCVVVGTLHVRKTD